MASTSRAKPSKSDLILDPSRDKQRIKRNIAHSIEEQVRDLDDEAVEAAVEQTYEGLLAKATVNKHIPTLTEGIVRAGFRHAQTKP